MFSQSREATALFGFGSPGIRKGTFTTNSGESIVIKKEDLNLYNYGLFGKASFEIRQNLRYGVFVASRLEYQLNWAFFMPENTPVYEKYEISYNNLNLSFRSGINLLKSVGWVFYKKKSENHRGLWNSVYIDLGVNLKSVPFFISEKGYVKYDDEDFKNLKNEFLNIIYSRKFGYSLNSEIGMRMGGVSVFISPKPYYSSYTNNFYEAWYFGVSLTSDLSKFRKYKIYR